MQMPESKLNIKTLIRHLLKVICGIDTRFMQMPESKLNIKTLIRHLLKVICGIDTRFILKFIPQIT
jgi:hypothetical protein